VDVALTLVRLGHEKVRHMPSNTVLVRDGVSAKHFLEPGASQQCLQSGHINTYVRALTRARSQFCLLIMEIISGAALPSSFNLPT
jgi:hypothetical protein